MRKFVSNNAEESKKFAQNFAVKILLKERQRKSALALSKAGLVLALIGELGSGKTTFAQNFAKALGVKEKIKSPTFIIMRKHQIHPVKSREAGAAKPLFHRVYHFDAYRIRDEKEVLNLGWQEIIKNQENIVLVEWADKIKKILPKDCVKIKFKHLMGNKRVITIS